MGLNIKNETGKLVTVVLGIAEDMGKPPSIEECIDPKTKENLINNTELANISKKLVTLDTNVPVKKQLMDFIWNEPNNDSLIDWLTTQGFKSIVSKVSIRDSTKGENINNNHEIIDKNTSTYTLINEINFSTSIDFVEIFRSSSENSLFKNDINDI